VRRAALPIAIALAFTGSASAGGASKVIGHAVRLKGTKIFYAKGTAAAPKTISASLVATPRQPVKVQWSVVCQRPNSSDPAVHLGTSEKAGEDSVPGAGTVKLALPYAKPHTCVATVYATLARNGALVLRLLQT
jgi:hypothetical protein